jgi:hypothetical protein
MKFRSLLHGVILISFALSGCFLHKKEPSPPVRIAPQRARPSEAAAKPILGTDLVAEQPPEIREAFKEHEHSGEWQTFTTDHSQIYPPSTRCMTATSSALLAS